MSTKAARRQIQQQIESNRITYLDGIYLAWMVFFACAYSLGSHYGGGLQEVATMFAGVAGWFMALAWHDAEKKKRGIG